MKQDDVQRFEHRGFAVSSQPSISKQRNVQQADTRQYRHHGSQLQSQHTTSSGSWLCRFNHRERDVCAKNDVQHRKHHGIFISVSCLSVSAATLWSVGQADTRLISIMAFRCQSSLQQRNGGVCGKSTSGIMSIIAFLFQSSLQQRHRNRGVWQDDTQRHQHHGLSVSIQPSTPTPQSWCVCVCGKTTRSIISIMKFPFQSSLQHRHRNRGVRGKTTRSIISIMAFPFQICLQH